MVGGSAARSARAGRGDWRRLFGEYNPARDIASAIQFHGGGDDDGPRDVGRVRRAHLTYSRSHGRGDFPQVSRCASAFRITGRSRSFVPRGSVFQRSLSAAAWRGSVCWWIGQDADRRSPRGTTKVWNWNVKVWTPVAASSALLFYLNRALRKADTFYGYAGAAAI